MAAMSLYLAEALLNHMMGKVAYSMPSVYLALCTTLPTAATPGTEVTAGQYTNYARQGPIAGSVGSAAPVGGVATTTSSSQITWPTSTGGTGATIVAIQAYDASTSGNALWWAPCSGSVSTGNNVAIPAANLTFSQS